MLRGFVSPDLDLNLIGTSCPPVVQCSRRIWILVTGIYVSFYCACHARNHLRNKHMNAVLRTWLEKEKSLADDRLFPAAWAAPLTNAAKSDRLFFLGAMITRFFVQRQL